LKNRVKLIKHLNQYIIIVILSIFLILALSSCDFSDHIESQNEISEDSFIFVSRVESETSSLIDNQLRRIDGITTDFSNNILRILSDNKVYAFIVTDNVIKADNIKCILGHPATIYYYGRINDNIGVQTANIEKVIVDTANISIEERAKQLLDIMSVEEKVGQMFLVRCQEEDAIDHINKYHLGGYVLFAKDFNKLKSDVIDTISNYQEAAKFGMIIATDEEGGEVNRISRYRQFRGVPFRASQDLYKENGWELITSDTKEKSELLLSLGVNINLTPVCDVPTQTSSFIFKRSFGTDPVLTSEYVRKVISEMKRNNIGSVLKHFPGYSDNKDTHKELSYDYREYSTFVENDFLPFISGINAGADAIMVSHNIVECMDGSNPASLSKNVHDIIRNELKFDGIIVTDDLDMQAIHDFISEEEVAVKAVLAGNDIICTSEYKILYASIIEAVKSNEISQDIIDAVVLKILCWKIKLEIID